MIRYGWLHVDGKYIKDESGDVVRLRGVNIIFYYPVSWWQGKLDCMFNSKLEALGVNVIRLATQMAYFPTYSAEMDWMVNWCKQRGIRVIIDCHKLPPAPTDWPFPPSIPSGWFDNGTAGEEWMQWWESVVTHYKDEPTVFGIGLLNEPHDTLSGDSALMLLKWKTRAEECVRRVKAINPHIIPFVSGEWAMNFWSSDQMEHPIPFFQQDPNFEYDVVFEPHLYPYYVFYSEYAKWGSFDFLEYYLARNYQKGWEEMQKQLEDPISSPDWADHWGIFGLGELPIFMGETGYQSLAEGWTNGSLPDDVQRQVMLDLINFFNKHQTHYTVWVWMSTFDGGSMDLVGLPPNYAESWMYTVLKNELKT
jgi:aryl-phospho-beta-D-glucosidase BglC (GH1 family)